VTDPVLSYARTVVAGKVLCGSLHKASCARHLHDLKHLAGHHWSLGHALHAIQFFSGYLRHWKNEWRGQPLHLEPWQEFVIGCLFGWRRDDGLRRFRVAYIELPRKNGKSTIGAGIALYLAFIDREPGAEVYCAATKREQARIVFEACRQMVLLSPPLRKRIQVGKHAISQEASASTLQAVSADDTTMDGLNTHGAIIDELHAHRNSGVVDVIETSMAARRQPLQVEITTAGVGQLSICWRHHDYSAKLLDGFTADAFVDPAWFAFIAHAEADDDYTQEATWQKANPNFGISVKPDYLKDKAAKARQLPAAQNVFRQKHLNQWTEQAERWIDMRAWDLCAGAITTTRDQGRPAYAGLDLASTRDLAACCVVINAGDEVIEVIPRLWIPEAKLEERTRNDRVPYGQWVNEGVLSVTPGNVIDFARVKTDTLALCDTWGVSEVGYDPWNALQLALELEQAGLLMVQTRQGYATMTNPMAELGSRVVSGKLRHGGHPVLRWMAGNMVASRDAAGNMKPDKKRAVDKIDGIVALLMGLDRLLRHMIGSAYEAHDLMTVESGDGGDPGFPTLGDW